MSYRMTSNFYPTQDPKNGYIGKADLTFDDKIRVNGISVFRKEDGSYNIAFPGYDVPAENAKDGEAHLSYVLPDSKEAYASMVEVVKMAVEDQEHHFGHVKGDHLPELKVSGKAVQEPYADGRYSLIVEDLCVMTGITSHEVKQDDGHSFIAVNTPTIGSYEKDGVKHFNQAFEGLTVEWEKDGKKEKRDYGLLIRNMVRGERKKVLGLETEKGQVSKNPSIDDKINQAEKKANEQNSSKSAPERAEQNPVLG